MLSIDDRLYLSPICAGCGAELMLTPSGHNFCADPSCTEGFDPLSAPCRSTGSSRTRSKRIQHSPCGGGKRPAARMGANLDANHKRTQKS